MITKTFSISRLVIQVGFAKSLTWQITNKNESEHVMLFAITIVNYKDGIGKGLQIFFGPLSFICAIT